MQPVSIQRGVPHATRDVCRWASKQDSIASLGPSAETTVACTLVFGGIFRPDGDEVKSNGTDVRRGMG